MTVTEAAKRLGISRKNLSLIVNQKAGISPEMAVKLGFALNNTPAFWLSLQRSFNLWQVRDKVDTSKIRRFIPS